MQTSFPPGVLNHTFRLEANLYWKIGENDFLSVATKLSVICQNKLCNPNRLFCVDFGSNFPKKIFFWVEKFFWTPLTEKTGKEASKMAFFSPEMPYSV